MFIEIVPNRNSRPAILLRDRKLVDGKMKKVTVANLSSLPIEAVEAIRLSLKGKKLVDPAECFSILSSTPHGHVRAILGTIRNIGLDQIISSKTSTQKNLILAMIVHRLINPLSKLSTMQDFENTSIMEELNLKDCTEDDLYAAMDWLFDRKNRIETKLANKHFSNGDMAFYDLSSSSYHGSNCELAKYGYNRDGEKLPCISYGIMTDKNGCPVCVSVYPGNTKDCKTTVEQVRKLMNQFGLQMSTIVGDRGTITQKQIDQWDGLTDLGWITGLQASGLHKLIHQGMIQTSLFDQKNLAEISSPDYPGQRLIVCFNPLLHDKRKKQRQELIQKTKEELNSLSSEVARRTHKLMTAEEIGVKAGKKIQKYNVGKYFELHIDHGQFSYQEKQSRIDIDKAMDGYYVVRTNVNKEKLSADDVVRSYKNLAKVESVFRNMKSVDIMVRPIFHRLPHRVITHIFICMLAYYVEWHMKQSLRSITWQDEDLEEYRLCRDAVSKATLSEKGQKKVRTKKTADNQTPRSFSTILHSLSTYTRNVCQSSQQSDSTFIAYPKPTPLQEKIFKLLNV